MDQEKRLALQAAKARVKELERPEREARKIAQAKARRDMISRVGKRAPEQRQPRERDPGYLAFLRRLPCIAGLMGDGDCEGATQAAHLRFSDHKQGRRNPGLQSKPSDRHATPLCAGHHLRDQHAGEERAFWNRLGIDPGDLSNALYAAYQTDGDGMTVLRHFCPSESNLSDRVLGREDGQLWDEPNTSSNHPTPTPSTRSLRP